MKSRWKMTCCMTGAVVFTLAAMCFVNPAIAHNNNQVSWSGLIKKEITEDTAIISSNYLSKAGRTVIVNNLSSQYSIPVKIISYKDLSDVNFSVISENPEIASVVFNEEKFNLKTGEEKIIDITITISQSQTENSTDINEITTDKEESVTETEEVIEESKITDVVVKMECVSGTDVLSGDIVIPVSEPEDELIVTGDLNSIQSYYNKALPINMATADKPVILKFNEGNFPAGTKYTIDNKTMILFDEGVIKLEAEKQVSMDLSETDISGDLVINTETELYNIKATELVSDIENKTFIVRNSLEIPVKYLWGAIEPTIKIEHLTVSNGKLLWTECKDIKHEKSAAENILLKNENAEAGTYRLTVSWIEKEITLYEMELTFFVRYDSAASGGTGQ